MSEYRRFISYIYEYRKGRKENNCGYAKVEVRNGVCRLRVHLQSTGKSKGVLQVYGFVRARDGALGIMLGNTGMQNQSYDFQVSSPASRMGETEYTIDDFRGIWLRNDEEDYITVWDDEPIAVEQFTEYIPQHRENVPSGEAERDAVPEVGEAAIPETERDAAPELKGNAVPEAEKSVAPELGSNAAPETEGDAVSEAEGAVASESVQAQSGDDGNLWMRWENFRMHYPHAQPFADGEITQCIRISLKDLSFLQREEWRLSRNTFVRQACLRYRHLLLGCHRDGRFVLAVPGTDDAQEKHMARMCGFLYYKETNCALTSPEMHAADDTGSPQPSGYWYLFLKETCFL